jgi:hypothetical protein
MSAWEEVTRVQPLAQRVHLIEHPAPVLSKPDFVQRYKLGEFGNASPTWDTYKEFHECQWPDSRRFDRFHLRSRKPGGEGFYNLSWIDLMSRWMGSGNPSQFYASAMAPEHRKTLQGEVCYVESWDPQGGNRKPGLYLWYNTEQLPMRDGMAVAQSQEGYQYRMNADMLRARLLLRHHLCANSYDWLFTLLDRYPDHVIEFSSYEIEWGTVPGFNTVFWEVRKY